MKDGLRYPAINLAEDADLIRSALRRGKRLKRISNEGSFVYVPHGGNAWRFETGGFLDPQSWRSVPTPAAFTPSVLEEWRQAAAETHQKNKVA